MVQRMVKRGALVAPFVVAFFLLSAGPLGAAASAIGVALALGNLWASGRVIGGVAENATHLLLPAAMMMLIFSLVLVTIAGAVITRTDVLDFTITGLVFLGLHLTLVMWEAAGSFLKLPKKDAPNQDEMIVSDPHSVRS